MKQNLASDPYDQHIHKRKQKQMIYENLNWSVIYITTTEYMQI